MNSGDMYADIILDYYRNPRNFGTIPVPDSIFRDVNPTCGDVVEMRFTVGDEKIADIKYFGKGCAISFAAAGMLTEMVQGKSIHDALKITKDDVLSTLGVPISPMRLKCALLGYKVLRCALYQYLGKEHEEEHDGAA